MKNQEYILFMRKGKAKAVRNSGVGHVLEFDNIIGNKTHPCEKPVELLSLLLLNSSEEGDICLDPFMGTGNMGIAAMKNGRLFHGIEIDKKYFDIAKSKLIL